MTRVKVAQNRTALYSENESRDPLSRDKVARLCRKCDIGLSHYGCETIIFLNLVNRSGYFFNRALIAF